MNISSYVIFLQAVGDVKRLHNKVKGTATTTYYSCAVPRVNFFLLSQGLAVGTHTGTHESSVPKLCKPIKGGYLNDK